MSGPTKAKLYMRIEDLEVALNDLVEMYVANRGNPDNEFISCITPKHCSDMTPFARGRDKTWSKFDRARRLLGETLPS